MKNQQEKEDINSLAGRLLAKKKFTNQLFNSNNKTAEQRRLNDFYPSQERSEEGARETFGKKKIK